MQIHFKFTSGIRSLPLAFKIFFGWLIFILFLCIPLDLRFQPCLAQATDLDEKIRPHLPQTLIEDESVLEPDPNLFQIESGTWRKSRDLFPAPFPIPLPLDEETKKRATPRTKKSVKTPAPLPEESDFFAEEPEEKGDTKTFSDRISQMIEFNNRWEISFVHYGRFRIEADLENLYEYQRTGQYLEVTVDQNQRKVLSLKPSKVTFKKVR